MALSQILAIMIILCFSTVAQAGHHFDALVDPGYPLEFKTDKEKEYHQKLELIRTRKPKLYDAVLAKLKDLFEKGSSELYKKGEIDEKPAEGLIDAAVWQLDQDKKCKNSNISFPIGIDTNKIILERMNSKNGACTPMGSLSPLHQSQKMTDPCSNEVQIERLKRLKQQGFKLYLIIGRTNEEHNQPPLPKPGPESEKVVWIYGDRQKTSHCSEDTPIQITADFDNPNELKIIPDDVFSFIIFDFSTFKFFDRAEESLIELKRVLKPGGTIYYELESAIFGIHNSEFQGKVNLNGISILREEYMKNPKEASRLAREKIIEHNREFLSKIGFRDIISHRSEPYPIQHYALKKPINYIEAIK